MNASLMLRLLAAGAVVLAAACTELDVELASERFNAPYVQSTQTVVEQMLDLARVGPDDVIYDLGSGDGRIPIAAAERYRVRKGIGIELNPDLVRLSTEKAKAAGVADRVHFVKGDVFKIDFSEATVITMYLLPEINLGLRPRLLALEPGTRVVSHQFDMGDWKPDRTAITDERGAQGADAMPGRNRLFLWIVPAKVSGRWRMPVGDDVISLAIDQHFQRVRGTVEADRARAPIRDAHLDGDRLRFSATIRRNGREQVLAFDGRVAGPAIDGVLTIDSRKMTARLSRIR
jgi:SAM-dependent methyltransferase